MKVLADENRMGELVDGLGRAAEKLMRERAEPWVIIGVRSRGDLLARRLAERIAHSGVGSVDITMYRDDLSAIGPQPVVRTSDLECGIDDMNVLLVDDVLMTGRSVRAAMGVLMDYGRPRCIRLAVLVDRGGRELPITADVVGMKVEAGKDQQVEVRLKPQDPEDVVVMYDRPRK
jgi:pyrimidine operon attenuation protein/uracil phosphoribosyltransferase